MFAMHDMFRRGGIVAAVAALLLVAWWIYDLGKLHGVTELESVRIENTLLQQHNDKLTDDAAGLREQVAILERSSQIDRQAADSVKSELGELEEGLQAAREEVEFYRGIVSPGDVKPGLRIHRFALEEGSAENEFHYELVLTQLKRNDKIISGAVVWQITGEMPDYRTEIGLDRVTEPAVKELKFRFRYFQELTGTITLPEGFKAEQVVLTIKPSGKGKAKTEPVVQSFDWVAMSS
ncbi:MAG: hypothetical protein KJO10_11555 [Gammaproteobacteria bacterium]|nr:hypothetical protein [Gammaproteobacteria bacterium]